MLIEDNIRHTDGVHNIVPHGIDGMEKLNSLLIHTGQMHLFFTDTAVTLMIHQIGQGMLLAPLSEGAIQRRWS